MQFLILILEKLLQHCNSSKAKDMSLRHRWQSKRRKTMTLRTAQLPQYKWWWQGGKKEREGRNQDCWGLFRDELEKQKTLLYKFGTIKLSRKSWKILEWWNSSCPGLVGYWWVEAMGVSSLVLPCSQQIRISWIFLFLSVFKTSFCSMKSRINWNSARRNVSSLVHPVAFYANRFFLGEAGCMLPVWTLIPL